MKNYFKHSVLFTVLVFSALLGYTTHNRAGDIRYTHVVGLTYRIEVSTFTKADATIDRPFLKIKWGDESNNPPLEALDSIQRIIDDPTAGINIRRNVYVGFHTYRGPGSFTIVVEDPNRNGGIHNIPSSINQIFCISSTLIISPFTGQNNSVQLLNLPVQDACINQLWSHNPGAFDPDGDLLVYSLVPSMGDDCIPLLGWELPDDWTNEPTDFFEIDSQTGTLTWDRPLYSGEYNIAIQIEEYRSGQLVGKVIRDMQITVVTCNNQPPVINPIPDYCIQAGDFLEFFVTASDPDGNSIFLSATGGPMTAVEHPATFQPNNGRFTWSPQCEEIRNTPYQMLFEATDNGFIPLSDPEVTTIRVVAPRVENPTAEALGNSITLNWNVNTCANVLSPFQQSQIRYKIYRRNNEYGFTPEQCELGVPAYTGYTYIGETVGINSTSYVDTDVFFGGVFCYMVVTCWPDGAESYASEEFCDTIRKDVPVLTNVSVDITDILSGQNTICWSPPSELDTLAFPGPYQYKLLYAEELNTPAQEVYQSSISPFLFWADTCFTHTGINTQNFNSNYIVQIYNDNGLISQSLPASSVFLTASPNDNEITLNFNYDVTWINTSYEVYRFNGEINDFELIGTTLEPFYTDTGLVNLQSYCYRVRSIGTYNTPGIIDPVFNWSQELCAQPFDRRPPCPPSLAIEDDCENLSVVLTWTKPSSDCADDVTAYQVYYAPTPNDSMQLIHRTENVNDTTFTFPAEDFNFSIAGCYAVTALDSLNLWPDGSLVQNESEFSNVICIDNCPLYELPNVFSPNGDGVNDVFEPFPYRYIESIQIIIYNRYGTKVFETTDPKILWNGTDMNTGRECHDGAYYYVIQVNAIRLNGIETNSYNGNIQLVGSTQPSNSN